MPTNQQVEDGPGSKDQPWDEYLSSPFDTTHRLHATLMKTFEDANDLHEKLFRALLRFPGVTAVDVGYAVKEAERQFQDQVALRIHVERKLSQEELKSYPRLDLTRFETYELYLDQGTSYRYEVFDQDRWRTLPQTEPPAVRGEPPRPHPIEEAETKGLAVRLLVNGVVIDVVEARYQPSQEFQVGPLQSSIELRPSDIERSARSRLNVLLGGVSIGAENGSAGTLGAVVWDRTDGSACVLSNLHVLAGQTRAQVGQACYQPSFADGGRRADAVGSLKRWQLDRHADAALAQISSDRHFCSSEILGAWHPIAASMPPKLGMKVRKWGRTTGFTEGFIDGVNLATNIRYSDGSVRTFEKQIHIAPRIRSQEVSAPGDSGALLVATFDITEQVNGKEAAPKKTKAEKENEKKEGLTAELVCRALEKLENGKKGKQFSVFRDFLWDAHREPRKDPKKNQRAYFAVGLIFAGDAPGSVMGEFALANPMLELEKSLQFSLRPLILSRRSIQVQQLDLASQLSRPTRSVSNISPTSPAPTSVAARNVGEQQDPEVTGPGGGSSTSDGG